MGHREQEHPQNSHRPRVNLNSINRHLAVVTLLTVTQVEFICIKYVTGVRERSHSTAQQRWITVG